MQAAWVAPSLSQNYVGGAPHPPPHPIYGPPGGQAGGEGVGGEEGAGIEQNASCTPNVGGKGGGDGGDGRCGGGVGGGEHKHKGSVWAAHAIGQHTTTFAIAALPRGPKAPSYRKDKEAEPARGTSPDGIQFE